MFMFSKKATKIDEIFTIDLTLCSNRFLIEFLDGTKKVQLAAKKSFLVGKKSFQRV
jgi:hypothetical protein